MAWLCSQCRTRFEERLDRCPADGQPVAQDMTGLVLAGRYTLQELIGIGGMSSSVWRAWQASTCRSVAVKVFPPADRTASDRFARGGRIASNLNHPHIVTVHDYGQAEDGKLYLVMELLEGHTLDRMLKDGREIPLARTLLIADQVLRALEHAHANRVVHRDLKPANLYLTTRDDNPFYLKVLDFGVSKYMVDQAEGEPPPAEEALDITHEGEVCGTPLYMSPEQLLSRKADPRTDLYALGVVLYRMLTGRFPFQAQTRVQLLRQILTQQPVRFAEARPGLALPEALEALVLKALAKQPNDRHGSAKDMRGALRLVRHSMKIFSEESDDSMAFTPPPSEPPGLRNTITVKPPMQSEVDPSLMPARPRRRWPILLAAGVPLLAVAVWGAVSLIDRAPEEVPSASEPVSAPVPVPETPAVQPAPPPAAPAETRFLNVRVDSDPTGSEVRWQGQFVGHTPVELRMPRGSHVVALTHKGYTPESVGIDLSGAPAGETVHSNVTLRPVPGAALSTEAARAPDKTRGPETRSTKPVQEASLQPAAAASAPSGPRLRLLDEDVARPSAVPGDGRAPATPVKVRVLDEDQPRVFTGAARDPAGGTQTGPAPKVKVLGDD